MQFKTKNRPSVLYILFTITIFSCTPPPPMNDFFGIKMDLTDVNRFKIQSYSKEYGATYNGTANMKPQIYAYAELIGNQIIIKIVNDSDKPLVSSYGTDQFILHTKENKEFLLKKGKITSYPGDGRINPSSSNEYLLELPSDYWRTVGMTEPNAGDAEYHGKFWTGLNQIKLLKEDIKFVEVKLGEETIIVLKPLPKEK